MHGRLGNAGHIGHVIVEPDGRPCRVVAGGAWRRTAAGRPSSRRPGGPAARPGGHHRAQWAAARQGAGQRRPSSICALRSSAGPSPCPTASRSSRRTPSWRRAKLAFLAGLHVVPSQLGTAAPLIRAASLARRIGHCSRRTTGRHESAIRHECLAGGRVVFAACGCGSCSPWSAARCCGQRRCARLGAWRPPGGGRSDRSCRCHRMTTCGSGP